MKAGRTLLVLGLAGSLMGMTGCATNSAIDKKIAQSEMRTDQKIESVETQVEDLQKKQREHDEMLAKLSREAADALQRASAAGVLAKGKVVFEETFSEDRVRFKLESSELTDEAKAALDEFAQKVKDLNKVVYIEIQGHTDSTGSDSYNEKLGQERADAVRRYLALKHGMPLNRLSTISYGELLPVADNSTREGRAQNRRVVLVVLE